MEPLTANTYGSSLAFQALDVDYNVGPLETISSFVRCMPADYTASRLYPFPLPNTALVYSAQNYDSGNECNETPRTISPFFGEYVVVAGMERPEQALSIDPVGNGVLEPGEAVPMNPSWQNLYTAAQSITGTASAFTGPAGATYTIVDSSASYGSVPSRGIASCLVTQNCYSVSVTNPQTRPVLHWDAAITETLNIAPDKRWTLHLGKSFTDVSTSSAFYSAIETVLHKGITAGCGGTLYCPATNVTRAQMAVFLVKAKRGPAFAPPPAIGIFADVPVGSFAADWIEELFNEGISAGCGGSNFCPSAWTRRDQMAVFLLKAEHGSAYLPPSCHGGVYTDVPCPGVYADWIEQLAAEAIGAPTTCVGGGSNPYCPAASTTREQMAGFIAKTFKLGLYGPF